MAHKLARVVAINIAFRSANEILSKKNVNYPFSKMTILGGASPVQLRKLHLNKIGVTDMSYIMNSDQNNIYMRKEAKLVYRKYHRTPLFEDFGTHMSQSVEKYLDVVGTWLIVRWKADSSLF